MRLSLLSCWKALTDSLQTGIKNKQFKVYQVKEAFTDPKTYLLFVASIAAQIPNGVVSNFSRSASCILVLRFG